MVKQRRCNIPPELRAMARAVSDADTRQFPDLVPAPGRAGPPVSALRHITTELNEDTPLSTREFKLFRAACEECREHLHSVTNGIIASGTPIADVLVLAVRMDILCTDLGLSLTAVFPALREIHTYLLDLSDRMALGRGESHRQGVLLDRLMRFLYKVLERGERALRNHETWETQRDTSNPDCGALKAVSSVAASSAVANSQHEAVCIYSPGKSCRINVAARDIELVSCRASPRQPSAHASFMAAASQPKARRATTNTVAAGATVADAQELIPVSGHHLLPLHVADAVAGVNADLEVHFAHIRWYVKVTDEAPGYFDARTHLEDNGLRNAWDVHVGRNRAACTTEEFLPFLPLFPSWTHGAVMSVLNFKDCGVISLYSLQRLLNVWGPLQLLEANLRHELESGAVDLSEPFAYLAFSLAARSDAMAGDYVVGLTDVISEVRVAVLRRARRHHWHLRAAAGAAPRSFSTKRTGRGAATSTMASPAQTVDAPRKSLATVSYTLSHATGAWMVKGLAREEFDSVASACAAFAEIFQRPCGQPLSTYRVVPRPPTVASLAPLLPLQGEGSDSVVLSPLVSTTPAKAEDAAEGNASALHRACYRNNARYVRTLLHRGGGTVINVALVDPLVSDSFCWTPLLCAVNNLHSDPVELVLQLLEAGAEVEYMDDADCTALYYAIANGYAETTRVLLEHCPTLSTSPYTLPLLVAIGAHDCHLRACDVQRLMTVVPTAAVLRVVVAYESSIALVTLASTIVEAKLSGKDHSVSSAERFLVAQRCSAPAELYTSAEMEQLKRWGHHHTQCCLRARQDVQEAVRVLYARQYALSWRAWLDALGAVEKDGAASLSLT
ncbi:conserved hypothetical protein [Leishmania mexicana MHOM/GT/2001/U1103]|uniref:Uncharacterized protein n=1 Tax=Leishmania mexicana (strain MHOM/GT/2001/U1103) TaxID=929439 RepID=E9AM21_LEIMU|nr:conserved hypothetical protein [Leishmania mexicana MHOM/GT/2001/U1103]CBZ23976.1 conserved hypothetical protein [Leishmania mexicana MHOM/GT/2001/U1103]